MSHEANEYQPQLLEEAERLLGAQFFPDGNPFDSPEAAGEELGYKRFIYTGCCRFIAEARREDRALASKQPGYNPREWNESWADQKMTTKGIDTIAFSYREEVTFKSRQLALITNAVRYAKQHPETLDARLFEDQRPYPRGIIAALQKPPKTVRYSDALGHPQHSEVHGVTALAPTGSGKSHILMASAAMLSVGKSIEGTKYGERPARMLLTVPSRELQKQWVRALQKEFPDLSIGVMTGDTRQPSADIVVSTIKMYANYFQDGYIEDHPVDISVFDEGHHLNEPLTRQAFLGQGQTGITLNFTATPAYDLRRDVRDIIPYVIEHEDMLTLIEKERLNDAQVFTFVLDEHVYKSLLKKYNLSPTKVEEQAIIQDVIHRLAYEFITPLLEQGRRGIAFTKEGNRAEYAKRLAALFNGKELPNGRIAKAVSMNSYDRNQNSVMDQYRAGDIDIVTSVDTGRQGLDAEFDFVLLLGNIESQLRGLQMVGRGTRRSNRFPVTVYGQFINIALPQNRKKLSKLFLAEQAFSNESVIRQGRVLNTTMQGKNKEPNAGVDISKFSELIRDMLALIDRKAMSEVLIGRNYELGSVEGKIPLNQILEQCNVSEVLAKKRLRAAGHAWSGRYERLGDKIQLVPYYSPEAEAYLKRIFPKQQPNALHLSAIAEAAGVHHQVAERNLTEEDRAAATVKPHANKLGYVHETTVWPADVAADIIDRLKVLKPRKLPAHLVPISDQFRKLLHNYRRTPREEIQRLLALGNFDTQDITITGSLRHTQAVSWSGFAHLQQVFGLPKGKDRIVIDPERLPTGPDDLDPEKVAYAQEIQRQFIAAERLERYDLGRKGEKSKPDHGSGNAADERT